MRAQVQWRRATTSAAGLIDGAVYCIRGPLPPIFQQFTEPCGPAAKYLDVDGNLAREHERARRRERTKPKQARETWLTPREIQRRFHWTDEQWDTAQLLGFPAGRTRLRDSLWARDVTTRRVVSSREIDEWRERIKELARTL